MIAVSDAWKALKSKPVLPPSYVELTYWITEPEAQKQASEFNNGTVYYSAHERIVDTADKKFAKYATLENNIWLLDGSMDILPSSYSPEDHPDLEELPSHGLYGDTGYVADAEYPMVEIRFSSVRNVLVPGVTIVWSETYGEYATRCRITALNGTEVVRSEEFYNDSVRSTFDFPITGYDRIYIEIVDWLVQDHRPRIEQFYLGAFEIHTGNSLVKYTHTQSANLLSAELPKNEISFSLDNSSDIWNPDNPGGNTKYLMNRQEVTVRYGYRINDDIEWIDAGICWLNGWETPANGIEAKFTARDLLAFMDSTYKGPRIGTLYEIAMAALTGSKFPPKNKITEMFYYVDDSLKDIYTDFSENTDVFTNAVVLQMCANAAQCVIRLPRDGTIRIEKLSKELSDYTIDQNISYKHPERTLTIPPKEISVNDGQWVEEVNEDGETVTVSNPVITSKENAELVGKWAAGVLNQRNIVKGTFRPDPRLDALDIIAVESKYSNNFVCAVTDITYEYNGAFKGTYTCREV